MYLRGSGGLEVHLISDTDPFDTINGQLIDFDAVFKKNYPFEWYDLIVGCGGCVEGTDPIVIPPAVLTSYDTGVVEPFP